MFSWFVGWSKKLCRFWDDVAARLNTNSTAGSSVNALLRWSIFIGILAMALVIFSKALWIFGPNAEAGVGRGLLVCLPDVAFFGFYFAGVLLVENFWRKAVYATIPFSSALLVASVVNLFWLRSTGNLLSLSVISVGLANFTQNLSVALDVVDPTELIKYGAMGGIFVGGWVVGTLPLRRRIFAEPRLRRLQPSAVLALSAAFAILGHLISVRDAHPDIRRMSKSIHFSLGVSGIELLGASLFEVKNLVYRPKVDTRDLGSERRNVIIVMLESANYKRSSFGDPKADRTPFIAKLARRGLWASNMRAVLPHSSKSIFSIHCGVYPDMRRRIIEHSEDFPHNCLPEVLGELGYRTAFFQSANGEFEARPRLVHNMGFEEYYAREQIHGERTTVINGDDWALIDPFFDWALDETEKKPFFATLFTSLQHINYSFPVRYRKKKCQAEDKVCEERLYDELYEEIVDPFVAEIFERLEDTGLDENTIVVVTGDHGEAFGEHGLWIHDNVYYDEGLRIPHVVWAKDLVDPGTVVDEPRSLIDVYPTVLSLLGVTYDRASLPGVSLTEEQPPEKKRYFRCWYDGYCHGYVQGNQKIVAIPNDNTYFRFDLEKDHEEKNPFVEEPHLEEEIQELDRWMRAHRDVAKGKWTARDHIFGIWKAKDTRRGRAELDTRAFERWAKGRFSYDEQDGLQGTYFADRRFSKVQGTRRDPVIDFYWEDDHAPLSGMGTKDFSIRWQGCVYVEEGTTRYLAAGSDDGMRIYLDDRLVVNNWGKHVQQWRTAVRPIPPGVHRIRIDYYQGLGGAVAMLGWAGSRDLDDHPAIIPPQNLIPPGGNERHPCPVEPAERGAAGGTTE